MKTKFASACLMAATVLTPVIVQAQTASTDTTRSRATNFVKDSVITVKIKAKLTEEKLRNLTNISVDTDAKGAVVLSGNVKTQEDADAAVAIARNTEGVTSVTNHLQVKPS